MIPPHDQLMTLGKPSLITELKKADAAYESVVVERDALAMENQKLQTEVEHLNALLREKDQDGGGGSRGKQRYANPHSKERSKPAPKKPGRKPGVGLFTNRQAPVELPGDEVILAEAPLPSTICQSCGHDLEISIEQATTIDIPAQPRRVIKKWSREIGVCPGCGVRHLGVHPDLPASQTGATANRVGPNAMASCQWMHYGMGVSLRRSVAVVSQLTGITLTQSAVTQDAERKCGSDGPATAACTALAEDLVKAKIVHTDDTSWAIGVKLAFVMGFFTDLIKLYFISYQHRSDEVLKILTEAFRGILCTDRGSSYDAKILDWIQMQKCLSHLLKNIKTAMDGKEGETRKFGDHLSELLREAIDLRKRFRNSELKKKEFAALGKDLGERLTEHLKPRELDDVDAQRLLDGIGMRHDNGQVLLFLENPNVEPTNNMAERDLRGAVISRKNSQCSKNERGADTFAKMKSIFATLQARELDMVTGFQEVMETGKMPPPRG
jgi:transposase